MRSKFHGLERNRDKILAIVAAAWCVIVLGLLPGAILRPTVIDRAPPLPPSPDRDAALAVTVLEKGTAAPLSHAQLQVIAVIDARAHIAGSAETDGSGRARIQNLPLGEVWLLGDARGFARASSQLVLATGERSAMLELVPEHRLAISVTDEQGASIEGAEVEVLGADPLPVGARTGRDGTARVARLADPPWIVAARAPGFEQVTRHGAREGETLAITLRKLGALVVTVVGLDAARVAGAHVQIAGTSLWPARVAETAEDGRVRISALPTGTYALRAARDEQASFIELGVSLDRGEEKEVTLRISPGRMVLVQVSDGTDSGAQPIRGARISLAESGVSPFPLEASTDRDGRARLGPIAVGAAYVTATAEEFVARAGIEVPEKSGQLIPVALVHGGTLSGRVADARGFPVDGARIEIVGTDPLGAPIDDDPRRARFRQAHFEATLGGPRPLIPSGELGVVPGPVQPIPHPFELPLAANNSVASAREPWVTRDDGTFQLAPVTPGRVRALIRHPQYVEALSELVTLIPGGAAHVDVVMHAGGNLEGKVVDASGRAVSAVRLVVAAVRGSLERTTRTATDGSFAFAGLPTQVTVSASRDEDDPAQVAARIALDVPEGGQRSVTITLPESRPSLAARVRDDRGYPIATAQLTVSSLDASSPLRITAFTDDRGEVVLPGARGLPLRVEAHAPRRASALLTLEASADSLEVTLGPAERITGEVRAARGNDPVEGAEVILYCDTGARRARTDRGGSFMVDDLPNGAAHLQIRAPSYAASKRDLFVASTSGHTTDLGRIELAAEAIVTGTVVDARGDPVPRARVAMDRVPTYLAVGATPPGIAVADEHGHFRLGELPEGAITLEAYAPDVGRARIAGIQLGAGRKTDGVKMILRAAGDDHASEPAAAGSVAVTLGETGGDPREVVVVAVAGASEAERAGIAPGDTLLDVDGVPVHTIAEARAKLSGPLDADVLLRLRRGDRPESLRVGREPIHR